MACEFSNRMFVPIHCTPNAGVGEAHFPFFRWTTGRNNLVCKAQAEQLFWLLGGWIKREMVKCDKLALPRECRDLF